VPSIAANGITIEYDRIGDPADPPMLLIHGLNGQMIDWELALLEQVAERGYYLLRYDNRDVGLSSKIDDRPTPDLGAILGGDFSSAPYLLPDMAADAAALLGALGIDAAHVVGVSMGGMIAQQLTIGHPERVLSLCSIMSNTGDRKHGLPHPEAVEMLLQPPPTTRPAYVDREVEVWKVIGSPGFPFDEPKVRERAAAGFDRCFCPDGGVRQLAAILSSPDRTPGLGGVHVPSLVIHGAADVLVDRSGGETTAAAIAGATLMVIEGMGHNLPVEVWDRVVDAIVKNAS